MRFTGTRRRPRVWHLLVVALTVAVAGVLLVPAVGVTWAGAGTAPHRPIAATSDQVKPVSATAQPTTRTTSTQPSSSRTGPGPATAAPGVQHVTTPGRQATAPPRRNLRQGMRGHDVTLLQRRLVALHYDVGPVDGVFGTGTRHAVIAFQKVQGLDRDGVVGPQTRAKLHRAVNPRPRQPRRGDYLEVNLDKQVLVFFHDRQVKKIIPVSTANGETYESRDGETRVAVTPTGRFRIQRKIDGWRESYLGLMWRPAYFYGGYAIHGSHSVPPFPASHGCIRVPIASMNRIFGHLPVGFPVLVY